LSQFVLEKIPSEVIRFGIRTEAVVELSPINLQVVPVRDGRCQRLHTTIADIIITKRKTLALLLSLIS
jgi:hypothetical protein